MGLVASATGPLFFVPGVGPRSILVQRNGMATVRNHRLIDTHTSFCLSPYTGVCKSRPKE